MIRRPPRSTLFPSRRSSDLVTMNISPRISAYRRVCCAALCPTQSVGANDTLRSEEHTSELQSRRDLVCRLLLEKKKQHKGLLKPEAELTAIVRDDIERGGVE